MSSPATLLRRETFAGEDRNIDARSIVTLIIFFVVNALVIWPLKIPLPLFLPRLYRKHFYASPPPSSPSVNHLPPISTPPREAPESKRETLHPSSAANVVLPASHQHQNGGEGNGSAVGEREGEADAIPKPSNGAGELKEGVDGEVKRWYFTLGLETSPVIGVLLLLASTCIPGSVVRAGIVGSEGVRPYDIMTLFISFAYISVSLDATGGLRYLAFLVASKASSSGQLLYSAFYGFWVIAGLIVGNDPLILSGTPFLSYFTGHANIEPPTAYLFTHFQSANLVSALLVSSNPTNLVLTSAFGISFLSYSAWLALPTVAGAVVLFPILRYWLFNSPEMIPPKLNPPKVNPRDALSDPFGAIFGTTLFLITIALLIGLSAGGYLEGVEGVWTVTAPAACVMIARDMVYDLFLNPHAGHRGTGGQDHAKLQEKIQQIADQRMEEKVDIEENGTEPAIASSTIPQVDEEKASISEPINDELPGPAADRPSKAVAASDRAGERAVTEDHPQGEPTTHGSHPQILVSPPEADTSSAETAQTAAPPPPSTSHLSPRPSQADSPASGAQTPEIAPTPIGPRSSLPTPSRHKLLRPLYPFQRAFPTFSGVFTRLPIPLIPFAFSMFILVESLQYTGWIRVWAGWWAAWAAVGGVAGSVWLMGVLGVIGCNVFGTNIGATVLLSRVMQFWKLTTPNVSDRTLYGGVFSLAVSSNFGAYSFVFSASLAGLLWRGILEQKGLTVRNIDFIRWNTIPVIFTMIAGCLVVAGEVCVMYKT